MPVYHTAAGTVEMLQWGEGRELFVLLHAAAAGPQSLSGLATALLRPGRRVVAPALDGYGATTIRGAADCLRANVAVLQACLDIHPAERRVVFGHSMGGLVALLAAIRRAPCDALALYEPIVVASLRGEVSEESALRDWDRAILAQVERAIANGDAEAGIAAFVTAWNETAWPDIPLNVRARLVASAVRLASDMRTVSHCELAMDDVAQVAMPVMILQGARSPAITHRMTARLQALLPHARHVIAEECGHMGPVQAPAAIGKIIGSDWWRSPGSPLSRG